LKALPGNSAAVTNRGGVSSRGTHAAGSNVGCCALASRWCRVDVIFILAVVTLYLATHALVIALARLASPA
jgi:hypothetical protein